MKLISMTWIYQMIMVKTILDGMNLKTFHWKNGTDYGKLLIMDSMKMSISKMVERIMIKIGLSVSSK